MKQYLCLSILVLLSPLFAPIHARNKSHSAMSPSPVATPAPGPSNSDCSSVIYGMMDCLSYITPGSNDTIPTKVCCGGILSVLQYNPKCVCVGLASSKDMGIEINSTRAHSMPTTCKLPIAAPHCAIPGASAPGASTPVSPSAGTPMTSPSSDESPTSPSSDESPTSSPSLAESPGMTAPSPSSSGTNQLSVSTLTLFAIIVSSITYILGFSN
ncbi:hypothetical protein HID58_010501 [Brassica napus]|uniref:Bifunctional inhibitor/plant lipid transfer protein/seed storage helical domain-containing protein n=1 Tax=Brassica napus TaxID=3708 RepID=A0ABQ8DVN8_BRANA|nr:non-specific lipid transfer protein GPI-anchored 4-like [Brassica napus]KAH0933384.1 hypothetical protein HID58_010501 [Brassica napus]